MPVTAVLAVLKPTAKSLRPQLTRLAVMQKLKAVKIPASGTPGQALTLGEIRSYVIKAAMEEDAYKDTEGVTKLGAQSLLHLKLGSSNELQRVMTTDDVCFLMH